MLFRSSCLPPPSRAHKYHLPADFHLPDGRCTYPDGCVHAPYRSSGGCYRRILIRIFGTLQNPLATGIGVVILCQIAVHLIMKKLKKSSYVQIVHEEYLKMNVEERKKHYKRGLWKLIPIFFYPIIIIAFLKLITVIFQVDSFSCNCL